MGRALRAPPPAVYSPSRSLASGGRPASRGRPTSRNLVWARTPASGTPDGFHVSLPAYCLERELQLREEGALRPDSDPEDYFHSIRQWAFWVYAERMDA